MVYCCTSLLYDDGDVIVDHVPMLVGVAGFEPTASSSRTKRATKLRHTPAPDDGQHTRRVRGCGGPVPANLTGMIGGPPGRGSAAALPDGGEGEQGCFGAAAEADRGERGGAEAGRDV